MSNRLDMNFVDSTIVLVSRNVIVVFVVVVVIVVAVVAVVAVVE